MLPRTTPVPRPYLADGPARAAGLTECQAARANVSRALPAATGRCRGHTAQCRRPVAWGRPWPLGTSEAASSARLSANGPVAVTLRPPPRPPTPARGARAGVRTEQVSGGSLGLALCRIWWQCPRSGVRHAAASGRAHCRSAAAGTSPVDTNRAPKFALRSSLGTPSPPFAPQTRRCVTRPGFVGTLKPPGAWSTSADASGCAEQVQANPRTQACLSPFKLSLSEAERHSPLPGWWRGPQTPPLTCSSWPVPGRLRGVSPEAPALPEGASASRS